MKKRIMCYGDSNTWGFIAGSDFKRYEDGVRWTSVLADTLGADYTVLEEGYNGRTTVWFDPVEQRKSGLETLTTIIDSCSPLDVVIIMLGTNDTKCQFTATSANIASSAALIAKEIMSSPFGPVFGQAPKVLLVSPPIIENPQFAGLFDETSAAISRGFSEDFKKQAELLSCSFFDAASCTEPDPKDGVHITAESHSKLGRAIAEKILEII